MGFITNPNRRIKERFHTSSKILDLITIYVKKKKIIHMRRLVFRSD